MTKKIAHLKENAGRYFYRRRVPERHQKTLGMTVWNRPCGDVSYQKAVSLVTEWGEEHDRLIRSLDDPAKAHTARYRTEVRQIELAMMRIADVASEAGMAPEGWSGSTMLEAARAAVNAADAHPDQNPAARLVAYRSILALSFGPHVTPLSDPEDRDEYEFIKRKLERRIRDIAGDPNTIRLVAERYYDFQGIRPGVRAKYRRNIGKLVAAVGDIPLTHLTPTQLRTFRDQQSKTMKGTSLASVFTPIKGMLSYAIEERLIEVNPMIKLPKDNRSMQARKWKPYQPEQVQRLFQAMEQFWGKPMRNLSEDRRKAIQMVVRVIAFSAMRPKEVVWLGPNRLLKKDFEPALWRKLFRF